MRSGAGQSASRTEAASFARATRTSRSVVASPKPAGTAPSSPARPRTADRPRSGIFGLGTPKRPKSVASEVDITAPDTRKTPNYAPWNHEQFLRRGLLAQIDIKLHPELYRLCEEGETIDDLLRLTPDQILLRWFNYHLKAAG